MANQIPEATVRNPLPATLWFLQHDARHGLLEADGFERSAPSAAHPPIFRRDAFHLHSQGFWLDQEDTRLVYRNACRAFYRIPKDRDPLSMPEAGEERVGLEEGFLAVRDILNAHEAFVHERCGRSYRNGLLQMMPISERRYGKNWKLLFGSERRPVLM
jgi:hypothetical protein